MMNEKKRLIKLLDDGCYAASEEVHGRRANEVIADYLLKHGVYLPLVNENDTVYIILLNKVIPFDIIYINLYQKQIFFRGQHGLCLSHTFKTNDIGKTVFLTREEAEKALKERETVDNSDRLKEVENNG